MKTLILTAIALATASLAHANDVMTETRITGAAALTMWNELNLPVTPVRDEHGGPDFADAKYGRDRGCEKQRADGSVECWILQGRGDAGRS